MFAFAKLLVAVDGGELTEAITSYALKLAGEAAVHFVCAVDPNRFFSDASAAAFGAEAERSAALEAARKIVDACLASAKQAGIAATGHVVQEMPVDAILDTARQVDADLIVMASHGRSGFARAVLGSVAEGVARQADVAVLFVPTSISARTAAAARRNPGRPRGSAG